MWKGRLIVNLVLCVAALGRDSSPYRVGFDEDGSKDICGIVSACARYHEECSIICSVYSLVLHTKEHLKRMSLLSSI